MRRVTIFLLAAVMGVMGVTAVSYSPPAAADFARQVAPPDAIPVDAAAFAAAFPQETGTPASDFCNDAPDVIFIGNAFGGTTNVTNMTESADDPVLDGMWGGPASVTGFRTVWYSLQTAFNAVVTIDAQTSNYDTVLGIFTGTCGALTPVTSNDDYTGFNARVTFTVKKNVTYYVEAADWSAGAAGQKNLNLFIQAEPVNSQWQQLPASNGLEASASALVGGQIYVVGGVDAASTRSNRVYRYDPPTNSWAQMSALIPAGGLSHATAVYLNGKIYTAGGDDGSLNNFSSQHNAYDISLNSWTVTNPADLPVNVGWAAAVAVPGQNGYYLMGGAATKPTLTNTTAVYNQVWLYDAAANNWTAAAPMSTPRYGHTAAYVGGQICVVGGLDNNAALLPNGECWTPGGGSWQTIAPLNIPRYGAASAVGPDGRWYIFGGQDANHKAIPEVEVYDPANPGAGWTLLGISFDLGGGLLTRARAWPTGQFVGQTLYALGGRDTIESDVILYVQSLRPPGYLTTYLPVVMNGANGFDDNFSVARSLALNVPQNGDFAQSTDFFDAYTISVTGLTPVTIRLSQIPAVSEYRLSLYDSNKALLAEALQPGNQDKIIQTALGAGQYYLMVERVYGASDGSRYQILISN